MTKYIWLTEFDTGEAILVNADKITLIREGFTYTNEGGGVEKKYYRVIVLDNNPVKVKQEMWEIRNMTLWDEVQPIRGVQRESSTD